MTLSPNMVFGRLTTIRRNGTSPNKKAVWLCVCTCGKEKNVVAGNLVSGGSTSCGCAAVETRLKNLDESGKRLFSQTPIYNAWKGILVRCADKSDKYYGGRGIRVCEYLADHPRNLEEAIGKRPYSTKPREFSVDRINNDGHYSCGKCADCESNGWTLNIRWATQKIQNRNSRKNRIIEIDGHRKCMSEWAEIANLKPHTILARIKLGWRPEELLGPLR